MPEPKPSEITSRPPLVDFSRESVKPPSSLYIDRDDRLYIRSISLLNGSKTYTIRGDMLYPDGVIRPFELVFIHAVQETPQFQVFQLAEGFLLKLSVTATAATIHYGSEFVEVGILRGRPVEGQKQYALISGYVEIGRSLSYPVTHYEPSGDRHGSLAVFASADPAAGVQPTQTVPANELWIVATVKAAYTTDATVANRFPRLEFVRSGNTIWRSPEHDPQVASTTLSYTWTKGGIYRQAPINSQNANILPDTLLIGGDIIRTAVTAGAAGDDWTALVGSMEGWARQFAP
jgi:hypothetical protein